ncbi:MAG TPA: DUF4097 family beta strand repeat-containing protein [Marmoricola sp.]|jgi:DUF4097 and DUF4098 domain-containing protein YvlB|nr:DUF4097 family beta strand repeat-containing protein [Marmoricola sp.]
MQQRFPTPRAIAVYVELGAGSLVVRAEATDETSVQVEGPRSEEFVVELEGDQLAVIAPRGRFFSGNEQHRVEIVVPEDSDLATRLGSADTSTTGPLGSLRLKTGSGDIRVDTATGHAVVESGSGDVLCDRLEGEVRVKSGSGDVELGEVHGKLGVSTGSGDIVLGVVHDTAVLKTGSGDLDVQRPEGTVQFSTASGDLRVARAHQGSIVAKSASGDVQVGVVEGTPVWTDINTVSGEVSSRLAPTGKPADGQPHLEIRANTVTGDVLLTPA